MNNMEKINTLIAEAELLGFEAHNALESDNDKMAQKVFAKYTVWNIESIQLLKNLKSIEYHVFADYDGVGGLHHLITSEEKGASHVGEIQVKYEGEDINSIGKVGRRQLESIIKELPRRKSALIRALREIKNKKATRAIGLTTLNFYFNQSNGELGQYPKEMNKKFSFSVGKGRYKLMVFLIEKNINDDDRYIPTNELTQAGEYKNNQKCRTSIHEIREKVEKTFQKIKGDKFIEAKQPDGYRIGKKINISFEDTP